ncbi:hypothetical protein GCM10025778_23820 [Paeniglutamicibacter antarcticus]|uniref:Uncharacterized protein n=1 Tax=Paeniglutamicibacter antarcticus TaxID=494023 RepID=A0ABP9TM10_9MICC
MGKIHGCGWDGTCQDEFIRWLDGRAARLYDGQGSQRPRRQVLSGAVLLSSGGGRVPGTSQARGPAASECNTMEQIGSASSSVIGGPAAARGCPDGTCASLMLGGMVLSGA